jgi:hypothetical protein
MDVRAIISTDKEAEASPPALLPGHDVPRVCSRRCDFPDIENGALADTVARKGRMAHFDKNQPHFGT